MSKQNPRKAAPPQRTVASQRSVARSNLVQWWPALAAIAILAAAVWLLVGHLRAPTAVGPTPAPSVLASEHIPSQGHQGHMPGDAKRYAHYRYSSDPPTSGYHLEMMPPALVNSQPLPRYVQVHLLEHGNILLQYNCLCPQTADALAAIAGRFNARLLPGAQPSTNDMQRIEEGGLAVVVAPYPSMKHTIALTAWTRLAVLDSVNEADIVSFINRWQRDADNLNQ